MSQATRAYSIQTSSLSRRAISRAVRGGSIVRTFFCGASGIVGYVQYGLEVWFYFRRVTVVRNGYGCQVYRDFGSPFRGMLCFTIHSVVVYGRRFYGGGIRGVVVRAGAPRRAFRIKGGVKRGTGPNRVCALANSLKIKGAMFARKITTKLKVARPVYDPAFAVVRRCRDKHLPLCRFSICHVNSVRRVRRVKCSSCFFKRKVYLVR